MPTPVINYAGQPYTAGASWQTTNAGNFGTLRFCNLHRESPNTTRSAID